MANDLIAPSLLSADFACLGDDARRVLDAGGDRLHLDVMDNHYVPNLTVGPLVCSSLRKYGIQAPIDAHLMATPVDTLIGHFAKAGATSITIHPESTLHLDRSIDLIRHYNCEVGIALNPATSLDCLHYIVHKIDSILVMSVNPGFGGQTFIPSTLQKIRDVYTLIRTSSRPIRLAVDGGINIDTIADVARAGADTFIVGSAIFANKQYADTIQQLRNQLRQVKRNEKT